MTELRRLASYCKFNAVELENVRDRLVAGCHDDKIREKLFLEPETLTLDAAIVLAQNVERASSESKQLSSVHNAQASYDSSLLKLSSDTNAAAAFQRGRPQSTKYRAQSKSSVTPNTSAPCGYCGGKQHQILDRCPARNVDCHNCHKRGHFARVCRSAPTSESTQRGSRAKSDTDDRSVTTVQISALNATRSSNSYVTVELAGVNTSLLIDTGAQASVISYDALRKLPPRTCLKSTSTRLKDFRGSRIPICGTICVPVKYRDEALPSFTFFVVQRGESILGQDLFDALRFNIVYADTYRIRAVMQEDSDATNFAQSPLATSHFGSTPLTPLPSSPAPSTPMPFVLLKYSSLTHADPRKSIKGYSHKPVVNMLIPPTAQPLRRVPLALLPKVKEEIDRMVRDGVLKPIDAADWLSNMVIAYKANGAIRICADLTNVNAAIIPDRYPLPTIEELSQFFADSTVFSKIDLKWGYLQVRLNEAAQHLTSMITPFGVYKWLRLPFGLCSAPSCFQKIIAQILDGIDGVKNLLDDIIISGRTRAKHDDRLDRVLKRLAERDVVINVDKSAFGVDAVDFVGHRVSRKGVGPLQSNIDAILTLRQPTSQKELRSFLGAAGFYRKFVPRYSDIVEPLNLLLKSDTPFDWTETHDHAFAALKSELVSKRVLSHFDATLPTIVTTDAPAVAIGAVLSQLQRDETERPVAFASRILSSAERNYSVSEREALACIWACEHWHWYLYGRHFELRTDHSPLTTLLTGGGKGRRPMRLLRWADRLNEYSFNVTYKPGAVNVVADLLSRPASADTNSTL